MKRTARLLNLYECIYGFAVAIVLVAAAVAVARVLFFREIWFIAPLALAPLGLLGLGVARRLREFRRYARVPGPKPSFFLGSLRSLRDAVAARRVRGRNEEPEGNGRVGARQAHDRRHQAGKLEIRPGLSNVLKAMSRIAPQFMFRQMVKLAKPRNGAPSNRGTGGSAHQHQNAFG